MSFNKPITYQDFKEYLKYINSCGYYNYNRHANLFNEICELYKQGFQLKLPI